MGDGTGLGDQGGRGPPKAPGLPSCSEPGVGWGGVGIRGKTGVPPRLPLFSESLALLLLLTDHSSLTMGLCSLNYYGWISFGFQDHEVLFL